MKIKKKKTSKTISPFSKEPPKKGSGEKKYQLRLYVAGATGKSLTALRNLEIICEKHLKGVYSIEVVDLFEQPQLAKGDQIFAVPTLIKRIPEPVRKIIGDLSNAEKVLVGLDLRVGRGG